MRVCQTLPCQAVIDWGCSRVVSSRRIRQVTRYNDALDGPTHATAEFKSTCKFSGSGETDVVWFDASLPGSTRDTAPCEDYDNGHCDQCHVTLDPAQTTAISAT